MREFWLSMAVLRAPEGDGGQAGGSPAGGQGGGQGGAGAGGGRMAAAAGDGGQQQPGQQPSGQQQGQQQGQQPTLHRPDGLPEHMLGKTDQETIDLLAKTVKGYRDADAKRGAVPKTAEEYKFEAPDTLKGYFGNADDPAMKAAQAAAMKAGLTQSQFQNFIADVFDPLVKAGAVAAPFDPKAEMTMVAKALGHGDTPEGRAETAKAVGNAGAFAKALGQQLGLDASTASYLEVMADTGAGVVIMNKLSERLGNKGPQFGGTGTGGQITKADLDAWGGKPEIDPRSPKFDQRERDKYDDAFKRFHGGK